MAPPAGFSASPVTGQVLWPPRAAAPPAPAGPTPASGPACASQVPPWHRPHPQRQPASATTGTRHSSPRTPPNFPVRIDLSSGPHFHPGETAWLDPAELDAVLRAVGQRLAAGFRHGVRAAHLRQRLDDALAVLEEVGGLAEVEEKEGRLCIRGLDCPLGEAVSAHRQVCRVAEVMLGVPVRQRCQIDGPVRCYFEVVADGGASGGTVLEGGELAREK